MTISVALGLATGGALYGFDLAGAGWSSFFAFIGFVAAQMTGGMAIRKRVQAAMERVQLPLVEGQKRLQAKMQWWQTNPPGSVQAAQAEMAKEQRAFVKEALARTEELRKFKGWVPMIERQMATAQFQLHWMIKEFAKVDELMDKAIFMDPTMVAMKLARMHMTNKPTEELTKVYEKAAKRLRYNQNVLLAAAYTWILVKRGDADGAFKALNRALEKSDNAVLKANRDVLANNRTAHFSNTGLGDQWYALMLEEPKVHMQRQRMQWR